MLIYSENRYISTEVNMMLIRAKDNIGYYYVHRGLYDQAVVLYDMFDVDPLALCNLLTGKRESRADVDEFLRDMPVPLNILGCFLLLVDDLIEEHVDRVGAVHVMSGPLNFRKMVTIPMDARAGITFSLTVREEYQLSWDRFFKESILYSMDVYLRPRDQPMNGTATVVSESEEYEAEEDPDAMLYAALMDDDFSFDDPDDEDEEEEEEIEEVAVEEIETVVAEEKEPTGLEAIKRLLV